MLTRDEDQLSKLRARFVAAGWAAILLMLLAVPCFSQTFTATVRGAVTDPTGTLVPGAAIELRNTGTNDARKTTSAQDGTYEFTSLLPGQYEITAAAPGFKTFVRSNMTLNAGVAANLGIPLELGAISEKVEVSAQAVLLDTESANTSDTMGSTLVAQLPTGAKTPLNFVFALAGTTEAPQMTQKNNNVDQMFSMFGFQGGRSGNVEILLDGAPATAVDWGGLMVSPTIEAVQEMQVVRNTYDAQYGKSSGGVVSIVSKGGSNAFHGVVYDFLQNDNLNANSWYGNANQGARGEFKRNQFGGNLTGPIWKRKNLYFMASYEGLREPNTRETGDMTVPTLAERGGDFSQSFNSTIFNPFSTRMLPDGTYTRDPFADSKIPDNLKDAVGVKVANLFPEPNRPGEDGRNNYYAQAKGLSTNDKIEGRVDWVQSEKSRIFARWSERIRQNTNPGCFWCNGADPDGTHLLTSPGWHGTINYTYTPSATWAVNALLGASRWAEGQTSLSLGKLSPGQLGLPASAFQAPVMPSFNFTGYSSLGDSSFRSQVRYSHTAEVNVTKLLNNHTFKFGGEFRMSLINNRDVYSGSFSFGRDFTSCDPTENGCLVNPGGSESTGNGLASLLLGTGGGGVDQKIEPAMSLHYYGAYFQDSWRLTPKLTVNLGIRYENQRPVTERFNRMAVFNPNVLSPLSAQVEEKLGHPLYGGFEFANSSHRYIYDPNNKDFAPRVGLAYKLTNKLVARSGFGLFYGPSTAMISFDDGMFVGYASSTPWIGSQDAQGYIPTNRLSNPFPNGTNQPTGDKDGLLTYVNYNPGQIWVKQPYPTPYTLHFSADVQYQLGPQSVVEVGYVGWRGRKLMYGNPNLNIDQLPTQYLSMGSELDQAVPNPFYGVLDPGGYYGGETITVANLLKPFPQYGALTMNRSTRGARASFNALNVRFSHQFASGLNILSTYQYSKAMDNGSEDFIGWSTDNTWRDSYNTMLDYGLSQHDMTHSFVTAAVYELPVGRGKKFGSSMPSVANAVLGGWQVSPIVRLNTGFPVYPIFYTDWSPLGQYGFPGNQRPNLIGNPALSNPTTERWFNTGAFEQAADYTIGNAPRNFGSVRESATKNLDLAVAKTFKAEAFKVQFRAEFLNAFNTPAFGGGGGGWGNILNCVDCYGSEASVSGVRNDPRNIQLGIRIEY